MLKSTSKTEYADLHNEQNDTDDHFPLLGMIEAAIPEGEEIAGIGGWLNGELDWDVIKITIQAHIYTFKIIASHQRADVDKLLEHGQGRGFTAEVEYPRPTISYLKNLRSDVQMRALVTQSKNPHRVGRLVIRKPFP